MTRRLLGALERNALLAMIVCVAGSGLLAVFQPNLVVGDTWMTLVAGREHVEHGLPHVDHLTVYGEGRTWTNQQWLAHLVFYGLERIGGMGLLGLVAGLCVVAAYAVAATAARLRGGSMRAVMIVLVLVLFSAPGTWTVRAQALALPLYAVLLLLIVDARDGIRRRTFLLLPVVLLWANLHGTAAMAAGLVTVLALVEIVRRRRPLHAAALGVLSWVALLATPYGPVATARYYRLLLVDPPFAGMVTEWERPKPGWSTLAFGLLIVLAVVLVARGLRRFAPIELALLLVTLAVALQAVRGLFWFALACLVVLPRAIGWRPLRDRPGVPLADRGVLAVSLGLLVACAAIGTATMGSRLEDRWPPRLAAAVATAAERPGTRVLGTDTWSDWLLWRVPTLRGRIADDIRFEIYPAELFEARVRFNGELGADWKTYARGFEVVLLDEELDASHLDDFLAEPGTTVAERIGAVRVLVRPGQAGLSPTAARASG